MINCVVRFKWFVDIIRGWLLVSVGVFNNIIFVVDYGDFLLKVNKVNLLLEKKKKFDFDGY